MSIFVGLLANGAAFPRKAFAAEGATADQAEAHIKKGVELRRLNRDAEALAEFQKALALAPSARAKGQLGLAEMAVGRFEAAEKTLEEVLSSSGGDAWVAAHKATLAEALERIRGQLGTLNISGEPGGARVQVNGKDLCSLPCSVHVQAGEVAVRVLSAGFLPILRTVAVMPRQISNQEFMLVKTSEGDVSGGREPVIGAKRAIPDKESGKESREGAPGRSPWPWVAGAAAIFTAGFGVFEAVQWSRKASDFNNRKDPSGNLVCGNSDPAGGGPGCMDLLHDGKNARLMAIGGLTIGAGLGVLSWVLLSRDPVKDRGSFQSSRPQAISCSPALGFNSVECWARF
jgi:hypothetical protein